DAAKLNSSTRGDSESTTAAAVGGIGLSAEAAELNVGLERQRKIGIRGLRGRRWSPRDHHLVKRDAVVDIAAGCARRGSRGNELDHDRPPLCHGRLAGLAQRALDLIHCGVGLLV